MITEADVWREHWFEMACDSAGLAVVSARFAAIIPEGDPLLVTVERRMVDEESWAMGAEMKRRRLCVPKT